MISKCSWPRKPTFNPRPSASFESGSKLQSGQRKFTYLETIEGRAGSRGELSVPTSIGRAPWRLLQVYEDERNSTTTMFRPNTLLAVTIPTVDPQRGRLTGIVVQLLTLVQDPKGELRDAPHAEWSVRTVWS